ncbi:MAG: DsbA family oxidoreductase [Pseudomonadota bacterium]|uniref:DsbA family oxidoreductase n=1 Tax=unclassified Phenylobacterium TaxID=2640670 RepID=UPI0009E9E1BA|nr:MULTISPECIES: DsbA family oxidoreductase [unclassified Phenylobacterium]MBT9469691.1 DsbA family oxidoreductase [Phenylobacterium sp.]
MTKPMKIDFVSDVSCPWCVVGLGGLEEALRKVGDLVQADIHFQPFELNPNMPPEGQNIVEHVGQKYGATPEQSAANRAAIHARAADVGFTMVTNDQSRIYNTFDAHRLLHWAGIVGGQAKLKRALFDAYFTNGQNPADHDVLVATAQAAGLDEAAAREVLTSGRYTEEVRAAEHRWQAAGINSVPAVVINDRYLISGGQPAAAFEQALRTIAAEEESAAAEG